MSPITLGDVQRQCLELIQYHHGWHPGCGSWIWLSQPRTIAILESLVKRGAVKNIGTADAPQYRITFFGQHVLSHINPRRWYHLRGNWTPGDKTGV